MVAGDGLSSVKKIKIGLKVENVAASKQGDGKNEA